MKKYLDVISDTANFLELKLTNIRVYFPENVDDFSSPNKIAWDAKYEDGSRIGGSWHNRQMFNSDPHMLRRRIAFDLSLDCRADKQFIRYAMQIYDHRYNDIYEAVFDRLDWLSLLTLLINKIFKRGVFGYRLQK